MASGLTIGIVTYDHEAYIGQAIDAALATGATVIVADDASTDGTRGVVESYGDRITAIFNDTNHGNFSRQANQIIDACQTEWVSLTSGDDYCLPGFEECCVEGFDWVYCDMSVVTVGGWELWRAIYDDPPDWLTGLKRCGMGLGAGVAHIGAFRMEWIRENHLRWRDGISTKVGEDAYTVAEWLCAKPRIHHVERLLYAYRRHDDSMMATLSNEEAVFREEYQAFVSGLLEGIEGGTE